MLLICNQSNFFTPANLSRDPISNHFKAVVLQLNRNGTIASFKHSLKWIKSQVIVWAAFFPQLSENNRHKIIIHQENDGSEEDNENEVDKYRIQSIILFTIFD